MRFVLLLVCQLCLLSLSAADSVGVPGSRGVNWDAARARADTEEGSRVIRVAAELTRQTADDLAQPPLGVTGWYHNYFCELDATRLEFDPRRPTEHVCPKCDKLYTGQRYDEAWRDNAHRSIGDNTARAAILYRLTDDAEWLELVRNVLVWYADHLGQFDVHGRHAGKGRIMSQSLGEARLMSALALAYWDVCKDLPTKDRVHVVNDLFLREAPFIHSQTGKIHNIHCWHNAAVGLIGFVSGNRHWVDAALDGPHGVNAQIGKGVKEDGFWYEGSIGYHFYTLSSLQDIVQAALAQGETIDNKQRFMRMYEAPIRFVMADREFPAMNDGWSGKKIDEQADFFERAWALEPQQIFSEILTRIYAAQPRESLESILYGPPQLQEAVSTDDSSVLFGGSGMAILRGNNLEALLKFSPYGGGHDHLDRLNLIVATRGKMIVPDLGTSGYGIGLNQWYRSAAAHNLPVVDGKRQQRVGGELVGYSDDAVTARSSRVQPGVVMQRSLALRDAGLSDTVRLSADASRQYDLFYHVRGSLRSCSASLRARGAIAEGSGYQYLSNLRAAECREVELVFDLQDAGGKLRLRCESPEPFEVIVAECPDNPADSQMIAVMLRRRSNQVVWTNHLVVQ